MGIRKKLLGVGEYNFEVLYLVGLTIRENQMNTKSNFEEYKEYWELWEWMVFWQVNQGKITREDFRRLYQLLSLNVTDFGYEYQRDDQALGQRFALLCADLQSVFRPHLAVAFLPTGHGSEIWPLTGKPVRNVRLQEGFGSTLPGQLIQKIENHGFEMDLTSPQLTTVYVIAGAFVHILKMSNDRSRSERLGIRASAYEILPFFICFDLFKFKP
jgi:hypothetical protein